MIQTLDVAKGESNNIKKQGYVKPGYYEKAMDYMAAIFLFTYYVLPQYFGLDLSFFDFTAQRIMIVVFLIYIFEKATRTKQFLRDISGCSLLPWMGIYLFILLYTAVINAHIGTILYSVIEFIGLFIVVFLINDGPGVVSVIRIIRICAYVLCILGVIEYLMGFTPFVWLETIPGLFTGGQVRSGSYRIMGPCNHSLGYGLALITMVPFACYNEKTEELDLFANLPLFVLIALNVLLTGSRSTLSIWGVEVILFFLFSGREKKKKIFVYACFAVVAFAMIVVVTYKTSFGRYVMLQLTTIVDELLGTSFALSFGADKTTLGNSSAYRELLLDIFNVSWLNPWLGKGSGYSFYWYHNGFKIQSIDNFYVANYIRYGYPGMIAYIFIIAVTLIKMLKRGIQKKSGLSMCMFIGVLCYFVNLWWLDTLQTIKYVYILFAFYYAMEINDKQKEKKIKGKYIR